MEVVVELVAVILKSFIVWVPQPFVKLSLRFVVVGQAFILPFFIIFVQLHFRVHYWLAGLIVLALKLFTLQSFLRLEVR